MFSALRTNLEAAGSAGGNVKYKLLAVDVDGTLLDDKHRLSENNRRAIGDIRKEGVKVIPFSGRGYPALKGIIETLKLEDAVVTQNGSLVLDYTGNKILHAELISSENCRKILDYCRAHLYQPLIYQKDQVYSGLKGTYLEIFETCMGQRVVYTEDIGMCYNNTPLGKILILDEPCRVCLLYTSTKNPHQRRISINYMRPLKINYWEYWMNLPIPSHTYWKLQPGCVNWESK